MACTSFSLGSIDRAQEGAEGDARQHREQHREARILHQRADQGHDEGADAEADRQAHAGDPAAHAVVDVAHDHGVGERDGAEHQQHEGDGGEEQRPALDLRGDQEQRHLQQHDRQVDVLQRIAVDQLADHELRQRGQREDDEQHRGEHRRILPRCSWRDCASSSPFPLVVKLKMMLPVTAVKVMMPNTRAITDGGRSSILALRLAGASSSRGTSSDEGDGADQADHARDDERRLPAEALGDVDREAGGDGDAHVAGQAVHADREAGVLGLLDQHRDADRVIDRGEGAHQGQRGADLPLVGAERDDQRRDAHAGEEDHHHDPAAPMVAEAAAHDRAGAEHEERAVVERRELGPLDAPDAGDDAPGIGEDHQDPVIHGVADVEQDRGGTAVTHLAGSSRDLPA